MDGDFTEQTDSESSPKDVDRLKLRDDASITEGEAEGRSLGKKLSVDFDNILDVLTVNESEFDNLPNVAGEVSESLLPKDSFASSFAPEDMSFKGSVGSFALEEEITSDVIDNIPSLTKSESHDVAPSGDPSEEGIKRDGLRKVTLEEMMIEAGQPIFQPISIEEPKLKKEPKVSKKKFRPAEIAEPELSLPSIVGTKPGKKSSLDTGASGIRMRREDKVDLKLPAQGIHLSNKSRIARNSTKLNSQEAEDVPVKKRNDPFLPDLPHTSPAETKREKKRKQKPLYMRMADKVRQLVAEEERQKVCDFVTILTVV
ncbi:hypothetical protein EON65_08195 [archaeon]|nr:MAG: hypothetical protein EON65_08195 [archaeon]